MTLEQRIELAATEAAKVAAEFSPVLGAAIQQGVAIEPVVSGFIHTLLGIFKHHAKAAITLPAARVPIPTKPGA